MAYYRETSPLIGYYFAQGKLRSIDGMAPIPEVAREIDGIVGG
jgi:adenylate kinase